MRILKYIIVALTVTSLASSCYVEREHYRHHHYYRVY